MVDTVIMNPAETEGSTSAVSRPAILAGGFAAASLSLALFALGVGRLRHHWMGTHTDEVYFRDTAHGFLAWAVATDIVVAFLASAATILGGGAAAGAGPERRWPATVAPYRTASTATAMSCCAPTSRPPIRRTRP